MIEQDRQLLARAASVNQSLGLVVIELMQRQDDGQLPADPLREAGHALRMLAEDMIARADELDTGCMGQDNGGMYTSSYGTKSSGGDNSANEVPA